MGSGAVTQFQVAFGALLLVSAVIGGFSMAWRLQALRSKDRAVVAQALESELAALRVMVESQNKSINDRVTSIEHYNAGTIVVLEHIREFQAEIKLQFETLQNRRSEDMQAIHRRLDALHNSARLERTVYEDIITASKEALKKDPPIG